MTARERLIAYVLSVESVYAGVLQVPKSAVLTYLYALKIVKYKRLKKVRDSLVSEARVKPVSC